MKKNKKSFFNDMAVVLLILLSMCALGGFVSGQAGAVSSVFVFILSSRLAVSCLKRQSIHNKTSCIKNKTDASQKPLVSAA